MHDAFALDPSTIHLNHGSFGAVPRVVAEAQRRVRDRAEANPMRFHRVESPGLKEQARHVAADFLGVGADDVALVRNVTNAIATVLSSLAGQDRLGPGDVVVVADQGFQPVNRAVARWCEMTGASYDVVRFPVDTHDDDVVRAFRDAFAQATARGERVRLVVVDHITAPTGALLPTSAISSAAHEVGALTFVDAAHAPGHVPARPAESGADFWSGTWHKWGFAPRGTTAFWVAEDERAGTQPLTTSWNHGKPFPLPFDIHGTDDYTGWFCLAEALAFWQDAGGLEIAERSRAVLDTGAAVVASALDGSRAPVPVSPSPCMRMVPLPTGVATTAEDAAAIYERLSLLGVEVQVTPYAGDGFIRLSGAVYNEPADYERLAEVLPAALRG